MALNKTWMLHHSEQMDAARQEWREVWRPIAAALVRNGVPKETIVTEETRAWQKWTKMKGLTRR